MADDYDFQINDLKFRAAVSDTFPYTRSTAPFRKEQFDAAPTVGDQSLTGWWTRGQLSFHKGAGLKYYEVLDGETVLNRYQDSEAVDVFTPGQVNLIPTLADQAIATSAAAVGTMSGVAGLFYANGTGINFTDGSASTAITTSDGGVPTNLTSDGRYYLATNGNRIERQSAAGGVRTNYVTNPNFETGTTGWAALFGGPAVTASSTRAKYGSQSLSYTIGSGGVGAIEATVSGLTAGATYVASAWLYLEAGGYTASPFLDVGGQTSSGALVTDQWQRISFTLTAPAASISFKVNSTSAAGGEVVYVDGVLLTEFPFDGDYFDGSTPGGAWTGTANASKSQYASSDPAASYALWEHGDAGYEFEDIWYAKGRIWAVDNTGRWYTLAPSGGTCHNADAIWASGKTGGTWSLADSPSSIFIAEAGTIYSVSTDIDGGLVGGYTAPVVAATLPAGELISSMFHYLGYLVVTTNKGVRVAVVQDSNLVYGPLVITGDFTACRQVGASGNLVYLVGQPTDHDASTVCVMDFTQEVDSLRPAWAPWQQLNNTTATQAGALIDPEGKLFAWAGNLYASGTTLASTGELTTGFHRFGTLDLKSFQTVSVRCGGDGGSITVSRVDADGTVTSLGSVTPTEASKDFAVGLPAATERIALKFTLTRDTTVTLGPELLGYQIKALPVPERQRILRWPILIQDSPTLRRGQRVGKKGRAYTDITTLETLEKTSGVVTFTDHRTGETGSAYIDGVEMQGDTPSVHNNGGFGGVAMITLRVLS